MREVEANDAANRGSRLSQPGAGGGRVGDDRAVRIIFDGWPMTSRRKVAIGCVAVVLVLLASMVDRVYPEGDHSGFLVIAPHPTLGFRYGGGEEGSWKRKHPGRAAPWWLEGRYFVLLEITDSGKDSGAPPKTRSTGGADYL